MEIFAWTLTAVLIVGGLIISLAPMLPGTTLILAGAVAHKLLLPADLSWMAVGWIALIWLGSLGADFAGVILGAKLFGGGKWGMAGAGAGALFGMFFSLPALLIGALFGAAAAEKFLAKKSGRDSLRAGAGATIGFLLSMFLRVVCAVAMAVLFLVAVWR